MALLPSVIHPILVVLSIIAAFSLSSSFTAHDSFPVPTPWPEQFHSILVVNKSGTNQIIDLWYDWPNGRNFNIIRSQLGGLLYDLEWNNGTSFYYTYNALSPSCRTVSFEVGILRPNWLDGATYLGQQTLDGFLCNVWTKADFIWYYEDVLSNKPVYWLFYTGMAVHVMTYEVGAVLEDSNWQAPAYCFEEAMTSHLFEQPATAAANLRIPGAAIL